MIEDIATVLFFVIVLILFGVLVGHMIRWGDAERRDDDDTEGGVQ